MAETHGPSRRLRSTTEERLSRLRGELVLQLYMQRGPFWEAVREAREHWNITAKVQLPPRLRSRLMPEAAPDAEDDYRKHHDFAALWEDAMSAIRMRVDPDADLTTSEDSDHELEASWRDFLSACVLYDPPDDRLVEFATYGGLEPTVLSGGRILRKSTTERLPKMAHPPVKSLWSLTELRDWYWRRIFQYVGERYLEPQGVDVEDLLENADLRVPGLKEEYREKYERFSRRYFIEVDDYTSEEDVKDALKMITRSIKRQTGTKPKRDRLVAVQCAVLHDKDEREPEDRRRRKWTHEKLAQRFGLSDRAAKDYVALGRKILAGEDPEEI